MKSKLLYFLLPFISSCHSEGKTNTEWIAKVNNEYIEFKEVDALIQPEMYESLFNTYYARKTMMDELISQKLLARKAVQLGISRDSLTSIILFSSTDSTKKREFIRDNLLENGLMDPDQIGQKVAPGSERGQQILDQTFKRHLVEMFVLQLREESNVETSLLPPLPPALDLSEIVYHKLSPQNKKTVFWLFSDYSCSHCMEFYPTYEKLMKRYGEQVNFRYTTLTDDITESTLLGEFAGKNGKMKEMNSVLFSEIKKGTFDLRAVASAVGLDYQGFRSFASDSVQVNLVKQNNVKLKKIGKFHVTPTIIINNRVYYGDISFNELDAYLKNYSL